MIKKRIISVFIVLIFTLGVASSGIFASDFEEGEAAGRIMSGNNIDKAIVRIKNNLWNRADRMRNLYGNPELLQSLENAHNEAEAREIEALELKRRLTPQQTEALEAYEAFLEKEAEAYMEKSGMTWEDYKKDYYQGPEFTLIYLDDDEIPELAVVDVPLLIYAYADGEVTLVGTYEHARDVDYAEKEGIVFDSRDDYKDKYNYVYKIKGAEEVLLQSSSENWYYEVKAGGEGEEHCIYRVDGKEVTYDEYEAELKTWDKYEKKDISFADCFYMLDGNAGGNLNQAMAKLVLKKTEN